MNNSYSLLFNGIPVIVTTQTRQRRIHKRNRINKKWKKRYGMIRHEVQDCDIMFNKFDGRFYVTETGYNNLLKILPTI